MRKTSFLSVLISILLGITVNAEVKLPAIISSNMVLQRNTTVELWGWADPDEKINIKTSWLDEEFNIVADKDSSWHISVKTTNSREPQTINIKGAKSDITLKNVLFGEVWICSGQSNMEQPLKGYKGQPTLGSNMDVAKSANPNLRLFTVEKKASSVPLKDIEMYRGWQQASPDVVYDFSAVAYFFGKQLQEILDVPIGLIHTSWGGSMVRAWISKEVVSKYMDIETGFKKFKKNNPTVLFNGMINPLIPYTIKGAIWYQAESDRLEPPLYKQIFPAMVKDWRTRWGIGDFPFYYVQIAPYKYEGDFYETYDNTAFIREAQLQCMDSIPNSGIAITLDIGDSNSIHPPYKKEVADRLLYNALNKTYGYKTVDCESPIYDSLEIIDSTSTIILSFKNAETGVYTYNRTNKLTGFEIAGKDKIFHPAEAIIYNKLRVFVKSEKVPEPVAVRYGWCNWIDGNLYDVNLLPAPSFRTDNWDDAVRYKE